MLIEVTQAHIDAGVEGDCGKCPVALAILGAFPGHAVYVDGDTAEVTLAEYLPGGHDTVTYLLPDEAVVFIEEFDDDCPVSPLSFELGEPGPLKEAAQ